MRHFIKSKKIVFLFAILLLFSGCFEIIEEVELNEDGSGSLTYTLNLSQSKTKINSALLMDSLGGYKVPDEQEIKNKISEVINKLKKSEGLTNVKSQQNFEDYIFTFSCDFKNIQNLNQAAKYLNDSYKIHDQNLSSATHFLFDKKNNVFRRKGDYGEKADPSQVEDEMLSALKKAEFTSIYRFNQEVKSVSNEAAKISPNNKAVMLNHKALEIATGKQSIENTIILK